MHETPTTIFIGNMYTAVQKFGISTARWLRGLLYIFELFLMLLGRRKFSLQIDVILYDGFAKKP